MLEIHCGPYVFMLSCFDAFAICRMLSGERAICRLMVADIHCSLTDSVHYQYVVSVLLRANNTRI